MRGKLNIAFCSSEVFPFAKTGGLGDVSFSLCFNLVKLGHRVKIFLPLYKNIKPQKINSHYGFSKYKGIEFFFIRNDKYFRRRYLYGVGTEDYRDNLRRFSFYCKKTLQIIKNLNFTPEIIHSNDWQTSLINVYLRTHFLNDPFFKNTRSVFTIHNLSYQGIFDKEQYPYLGLPEKYFNLEGFEFYGKINLLKAGLLFSDAINTVSPTYSREIQEEEKGYGLEGVLKKRAAVLRGILNGVDYEVWSPEKDKFIYKKYSSASIENKHLNKLKLQSSLNLKKGDGFFLLGMVSRLIEQKGVDIVIASLEDILKKAQLIILGVGEKNYEKILKRAEKKYPGLLSLNLKFDEALAHKVYAASDAMVVPSKFEPCGLSQLIAYKYGSPPIVRATGGLADTVCDYRDKGGGFVFTLDSPSSFVEAVSRAYSLFKNKEKWFKLLKKIMRYDYSWQRSVTEYIKMYREALSRPPTVAG